MKTILLAAAALIAGPAIAQTTPAPATSEMAQPMPQTAPAPMPATPDTTMAPDTAPMPATAPDAMPMAAAPTDAMPAAPMAATKDYPWCSKTVTDSCRERNGLK